MTLLRSFDAGALGRAWRWFLPLAIAVQVVSALLFRPSITPTGDEPHYLMVVRSIISDRDFDVANQYADGHFRIIYGGDLPVDFQAHDYRGDGRLFFARPPGQALLLAPAAAVGSVLWWLAGSNPVVGSYIAVVLFQMAVAVLFWLVLAEFATALTGNCVAAILSTVAVGATLPVLPYGSQIYPELTAALLILIALRAIHGGVSTHSGLALLGLAIGILPWLHLRYAPIALICVGFAAWQWLLGRAGRALLIAAIVGALVSANLLAAYSLHAYGSPLPTAGFSHFRDPVSNPTNIPRSIGFLLFDEGQGLLAYAPFYVVAFFIWLGQILLGTRSRRGVLITGALIGLSALVTGASAITDYVGFEIPPRYLVSVLPLSALPLTCALVSRARAIVAAAALLLLVPGLVATAYGAAAPVRLYDVGLGNRVWADASLTLYRRAGIDLRPNALFPSYRPLEATIYASACLVDSGDTHTCRLPIVPPPGDYEARLFVLSGDASSGLALTFDITAIDPRGAAVPLASRSVRGDDPDGVSRIVLGPRPPNPIDPELRRRAVAATGLPDPVVVDAYLVGATYFRLNRRVISTPEFDARVRELAARAGAPSPAADIGRRLIDIYAEVANSPLYGVVYLPFRLGRESDLRLVVRGDGQSLRLGGLTVARFSGWQIPLTLHAPA